MSSALVEHLDTTDTVAIITTRKDGTEVATPIWSMVVDGVAYLRSVRGARAGWYLRALSGRPVTFSLADGGIAERDPVAALATEHSAPVKVTAVADDDPVQSAIDDALRAKYPNWGSSLTAMLVAPAIECTVRIDPA